MIAPETYEGMARGKLTVFAHYMWPKFRMAAHHRLIAEALVRADRGELKRLIITMPPRHGKSLLCSEMFPAWCLGRHPTYQIIAASHTQELADDFGRKVRNLMRDPSYAMVFPGVSLRDDSTSAKRFHTNQGGVYVAAGVNCPIAGKGADLLLIDDPIRSSADAESELVRTRLKAWYASDAYSRLMPNGAIIVIQTRWHTDDLAGWLIAEHQHEGWEVLNLPATAEEDDPLGRKFDEALWPSQFPYEVLMNIKETISKADGIRNWFSLYQQRPYPREGNLVKLSWFPRWNELPEPKKTLRTVQSWDTAYKPEQINDPSVCTTWIQSDGKYFLADVFRARLEYPALKRAIAAQAEKWNPSAILIEDKASGQSLIQELRGKMPVISVDTEGQNKVIRLSAVSGLMEGGMVYLPQSAPWLGEYEAELASFPNGKHDDQVDSTSQFLKYSRAHSGRFTIFRVG